MADGTAIDRQVRMSLPSHAEPPVESFSLIRGDALFRLQRAVGLIPAQGLGVVRRAVFYALLTWLPIAVAAALRGRALDGALDEPLLAHFGVTVRCLVAIPLLILAEGVAHGMMVRLLPQFVRAGLVSDPAAFRRVLEGFARLRDRTLPWVVIGGLVFAWTLLAPQVHEPHELLWAVETPAAPSFGFGGWWYLYVARPVYVTLVLAWAWRLALLVLLLKRIAGLDLSLVPTHPDRRAGLGFLAPLPGAFAPVVLALSAVLAAGWAHDVVYHDVAVGSLKAEALAFVVVLAVLVLAPLAVFMPLLARTKKRALLDYAALVGEHGRAVHARWIERRPVSAEREALLSASELGPVADTQGLYQAVAQMQTLPVDRKSVLAVVAPAVVPMIVVAALKIPLKTLLLSILKALA
jgi:hypothetical protein